MHDLSVITATFRSPNFLAARRSVTDQVVSCEHVVVDGASGPTWTSKIAEALDSTDTLISEPDSGIYDALNKGVLNANGKIIGLLHSDDRFASPMVTKRILKIFENTLVDVVYGDLVYVDSNDRIVRKWISRTFRSHLLTFGWMPPHPTLFIRRSIFDKIGLFDTSYKISGDYEFILRLFKTPGVTFNYFPTTITRMTLGGASNRNLGQILQKMQEDLRAMRTHGINPWVALPSKNLQKLVQFLHTW